MGKTPFKIFNTNLFENFMCRPDFFYVISSLSFEPSNEFDFFPQLKGRRLRLRKANKCVGRNDHEGQIMVLVGNVDNYTMRLLVHVGNGHLKANI